MGIAQSVKTGQQINPHKRKANMTSDEFEVAMDDFHSKNEEAALLITRLAMALNDISKANYLHELQGKDNPKSANRRSLRFFLWSISVSFDDFASG